MRSLPRLKRARARVTGSEGALGAPGLGGGSAKAGGAAAASSRKDTHLRRRRASTQSSSGGDPGMVRGYLKVEAVGREGTVDAVAGARSVTEGAGDAEGTMATELGGGADAGGGATSGRGDID